MNNIGDIGKLLRDTRKAKDLTLEVVNKKTLISEKILKSLEDGTCESSVNTIYVRGFIKKYADFLGLNSADILDGYGTKVEQILHIDPKKPSDIIEIEKYIPFVLTVFFGILIVAGLVLGVIKIKQFFANRPQKSRITKMSKQPLAGESLLQKNAAGKEISPKESVPQEIMLEKIEQPRPAETPKTKEAMPVPAEIRLSIASTSDVWLRVEKDGNEVFKGILKKGRSESWICHKQFKIRAGKLESLEFSVNNKYLGKIGRGVEDIVIGKNVLKVGNKIIQISR